MKKEKNKRTYSSNTSFEEKRENKKDNNAFKMHNISMSSFDTNLQHVIFNWLFTQNPSCEIRIMIKEKILPILRILFISEEEYDYQIKRQQGSYDTQSNQLL